MTADAHGNGAGAQAGTTSSRADPGTVLVVAARPQLDDALAVAAADLRRPAALLSRQLRRLRRRGRPIAPVTDRTLACLEAQASRIAEIADVLAELEAIEHGRVQLRKRPVEVGPLLSRAAASLDARGAAVVLAGAPDRSQHLLADAERLERAVRALLEAFGAARRGSGRVQIAADPSPDGVCISVELRPDPGSPPRRAPRIERLACVEVTVARQIAELHGGSLEIAGEGAGLRARMLIPTAVSEADAPPAPGPAADGERPRILVVDDDEDARETLGMMLADDYDVVLAADGQEAIERSRAERLSAVLMDLYMPRLDGLSALETMRANPATADVPVILISARGDELTRSRSLDLGAVDFLQKPFSARELKARIERTLRLTRREVELQELARTDPLTGLANVRAFRTRLEEEIKRARRYRNPLACVMVDMDHLKAVNDELGHVAGDLAIRAMADVIRRELRATDFGARYGGDEFVLLLPHTTSAEARVFAERVAQRLDASPLELRGRVVPLGASFGIAAFGADPGEDAGELLVHRADAALYAAKRAGRGRVELQQPSPAGEDQSPVPP